jgi:S-phase kinase-associated protein 1
MSVNKKIKIVSGMDQTLYEIESDIAVNSGLLKSLIEEYPEANEFLVPEIKGEILFIVLCYLENLYKVEKSYNESKLQISQNIQLPKPLSSYDLKNLISDYDYNLLENYNQDIYRLFELMTAANYLDVKNLVELCCAKVACLVKDYEKEEFLEVFQIEQDMTEADLQEKLKIFK